MSKLFILAFLTSIISFNSCSKKGEYVKPSNTNYLLKVNYKNTDGNLIPLCKKIVINKDTINLDNGTFTLKEKITLPDTVYLILFNKNIQPFFASVLYLSIEKWSYNGDYLNGVYNCQGEIFVRE